MKKIVQKEDPVLRKKAERVLVKDIKTQKIKTVIAEMSESLASQHDGVAIAAPQIGYSLSMFLVSGKIFHDDFERGKDLDQISRTESQKDLVFINPKIIKLSKDRKWVPEGCLSVRWFYGETYRATKATIEAYDENGKKFTRGASGLLAQIFQHETDHLKGILFTDHAENVKEENPI